MTSSARALDSDSESDHFYLEFQAARDLMRRTESNRRRLRSVQLLVKSNLKLIQAVLDDADDEFGKIQKAARKIEDSDNVTAPALKVN